MNTFRGCIAAGHQLTAQAGCDILQAGGNAFDAAVAAAMVSCVAENTLTSFGGGGFLNAFVKNSPEKSSVYDFFVQTPSTKAAEAKLDFYPIGVDFGDAVQEFFIGKASMGVPGMFAGLKAVQEDLGVMPWGALLEPAIALAKGHTITAFQASFMGQLEQVLRADAQTTALYAPGGKILGEGESLKMGQLADLLSVIGSEGVREFYEGEPASNLAELCAGGSGHLCKEDFAQYQVIRRPVLSSPYRGALIHTNPAPSAGGSLIVFGLKLLEALVEDPAAFPQAHTPEWVKLMATVMVVSRKMRTTVFDQIRVDPDMVYRFLQAPNDWLAEASKLHQGWGSTTHISVLDKEGNAASITSSVGQGAGVLIPGTDIMMNNMLGERDLNPEGFHRWASDTRITSMMAPTIISREGKVETVIGTGGANRIRTALLQIISRLLDSKLPLEQAIRAPRLHLEGSTLDVEAGFDPGLFSQFEGTLQTSFWEQQNLYFGGIHGITASETGIDAFGDPRRTGVALYA